MSLRRTGSSGALVALFALLAGCSKPRVDGDYEVSRTFRWDTETLEMFSELPVQQGGRVKPLSTLAGFQLLNMYTKRSFKIPGPDGGKPEKLDPSGWMLDCLFFPEQARHYETFSVLDDELITMIGLEFEGKKRRDYYSYAELLPGRVRLQNFAASAHKKEAKVRERLEQQALSLYTNMTVFEGLVDAAAYTRHTLALHETPALAEVFPDVRPGLTPLLGNAAELVALYNEPELSSDAREGIERLLDELHRRIQFAAHDYAYFVPSTSVEERPGWLDFADVVQESLSGAPDGKDNIAALAAWERMEAAKADPAAFQAALADLHELSVARAEARGEYGKIPLEVSYYARDYFTNALAFFLLAFLLLAFGWLWPARWLGIGAWGGVTVGLLLVLAGITARCIILSRPPVATLYETILFITSVVVLVGLVIEALNRRRIALVTSTLVGAAGMFLAMRYELKEAASQGDTMGSLVAVLRTNYYLATHVTTVTIGYSAGLLAGLLAHVWLVGKMLGFRKGDKAFYKDVTRMVYGVLCFGLLFSVLGTIWGGVWANDSWGRFWGWDPKENGALLIILWELLILHSRLGGFIRDRGLHVMAVVGGVVVSASWWGVNLLGVGLHSYGFTSGVMRTLAIFWLIEFGLLVGFGIWSLVKRSGAHRVQSAEMSASEA
jgi:ABC-type transport system involved in cytochrome c biogenesis permease subunit